MAMALSQPLYVILRWMFQQGLLPQNGALLEFGEANWYGDMTVESLIADIETLVADPGRRAEIVATLRKAGREEDPDDPFTIVKAVYAALFSPTRVHAIDLHGSPAAFRYDLNGPVTLPGQYECTINNGTAEHIFNIGQFFKTVHESTAPSGLMLHEAPFTGWVNHGFYTLQPTLYMDVGVANGYEPVAMFLIDWKAHRVEPLPDRRAILAMIKERGAAQGSTNLFVALRKPAEERPFAMPFQGYYADTLPPEERAAWDAGAS
jgi:hypothetical protein